MKRLLDLGVDVNFADESNMDMPALSSVAYFGFKDIAKFLLNAGADRKRLYSDPNIDSPFQNQSLPLQKCQDCVYLPSNTW